MPNHKKIYCPNIELSCPKFPYLCCMFCGEQEECTSVSFKCYRSALSPEQNRGLTRSCGLKFAMSKTELVFYLIFGRRENAE